MNQRWQDWIGLMLGIWLFLSPWWLGYVDMAGAALSAWIIGLATIIVFSVALGQPCPWEEGVNIALAVLLFAAPFAFWFVESWIAWNHWIMGVLIAGDALWALIQKPMGSRGTAA